MNKITPPKLERLYPVGFIFTLPAQSKKPARHCEIIDHEFRYNSKGEFTKMRYHVSYNYINNQSVIDRDVVQATIDIATNNGWKELKS